MALSTLSGACMTVPNASGPLGSAETRSFVIASKGITRRDYVPPTLLQHLPQVKKGNVRAFSKNECFQYLSEVPLKTKHTGNQRVKLPSESNAETSEGPFPATKASADSDGPTANKGIQEDTSSSFACPPPPPPSTPPQTTAVHLLQSPFSRARTHSPLISRALCSPRRDPYSTNNHFMLRDNMENRSLYEMPFMKMDTVSSMHICSPSRQPAGFGCVPHTTTAMPRFVPREGIKCSFAIRRGKLALRPQTKLPVDAYGTILGENASSMNLSGKRKVWNSPDPAATSHPRVLKHLRLDMNDRNSSDLNLNNMNMNSTGGGIVEDEPPIPVGQVDVPEVYEKEFQTICKKMTLPAAARSQAEYIVTRFGSNVKKLDLGLPKPRLQPRCAVASALYLGCLKYQPRDMQEFVTHTRISARSLTACAKELALHANVSFQLIKPSQLIDRLCLNAKIPPSLISFAHLVLSRAVEKVPSVSRASSICLAAAVVYLVAQDPSGTPFASSSLSCLADMAKIANVQQKALSKVFEDLQKVKSMLVGVKVPSSFTSSPSSVGKGTVMRL